MAEKFVLISALEPLERGDQFEQWPLHVTIVPWFALPKEREQAFLNALVNRVYGKSSFVTTGGDEALFGPDKDVRVRKLRRIGALAALHNIALGAVHDFDGVVDGGYVGRDYVPHVTYQGERGIEEGQELELSAMQLVRGDVDGSRTVERVFYFIADNSKRNA